MQSLILIMSLLIMPGEVEDAMLVLEHLQSAVSTVEYSQTPLEAILVDLGAQAQVTIQGDWDTLMRLGIEADDRLTFSSDRTDVLTILMRLEVMLGDEYERPIFEVHAGRVLLTTIEATASMRLLDVYDVRDLLRQPALIQELRDERPPLMDPTETASEVDQDTDETDDEAELPTPPTPGEELLLLLIDHVDPEAWINYGGDIARIDERDGVLFVSAAPRVHRHLHEALRMLRRTNPSQVHVHLQLIELPCDSYRLLTQRHRKGSPMLMESLKGHGRSNTLWKQRVSIMKGEQATLEAESEGSSIVSTFSPQHDPETGLISLAMEFAYTDDDTRRAVTTTLAFGQGRSRAVLEIPSIGETSSILVLLITIDPE